MIKPTIHLNGSSAERLREAYETAANAITTAIAALAETAPNARDYYPQGPSAFPLATEGHLERMKRLDAVRAELMELWDHVNGVICENEQRRSARRVR